MFIEIDLLKKIFVALVCCFRNLILRRVLCKVCAAVRNVKFLRRADFRRTENLRSSAPRAFVCGFAKTKICVSPHSPRAASALQKQKFAFPCLPRSRLRFCKSKNSRSRASARSSTVRQIPARRAGFHFFAPAFLARGGAYYDNICTKTSRAARGWRSGAI